MPSCARWRPRESRSPSGSPAARSSRCTTRSRAARPCATCSRATSLVTPIADAWMDSTPLVCITGQVRSSLIGTDAFQETDATGITLPIVKHSWLVQDIDELPHVLKAAFHVARTGRSGPVLVDIAKDVQEAEFDFRYPDEVDLPGWRPPRRVHPRQVAEAARALAQAQKPVLYVGGGAINANACAEVLELAEA